MIDTREELINALTEAAEIEHGLLVQYLFAAFSLKRRLDEGITPSEQALISDWEGIILGVARDEMKHLGMVCNLLGAIGGAPRFGRPNFPQPAKKYYPWDFDLIPFSDEALYRFICFELPEGEAPPPPPTKALSPGMNLLAIAPEPIFFNHVGELYGLIRNGFFAIDEKKLFIGPKFTQDVDEWTLRWQIPLVVDRASAEAAIKLIVEEGEGSPEKRENSHYGRFLAVRKALSEAKGFIPARPVVKNPRTQDHPDASSGGTLITSKDSKDVVELFNAVYNSALLMLMQYYSFGGETTAQRQVLRSSIGQMMSAIIRPLAEVATTLPATDDPTKGNAGPSFEIYADLRLATTPANRWAILLERFSEEVTECNRLVAINPRLKTVATQLGWLRQNIEQLTVEV